MSKKGCHGSKKARKTKSRALEKQRRPRIPLLSELTTAPSIEIIVSIATSRLGPVNEVKLPVADEFVEDAEDPIEDVLCDTSMDQSEISLGNAKVHAQKRDNFDFARFHQSLARGEYAPMSPVGDGFDPKELQLPGEHTRRGARKPKAGPQVDFCARLTLSTSMQLPTDDGRAANSDCHAITPLHQNTRDRVRPSADEELAPATQRTGLRHLGAARSRNDLVRSQLQSLTAPARMFSDSDEGSDDGSDSSDQSVQSHSEVAGEPDPTLPRVPASRLAYSPISDQPVAAPSLGLHAVCPEDEDMESTDMLLDDHESAFNSSLSVLARHAPHTRTVILNQPGRLSHTRSTGPWNQTAEEIDDESIFEEAGHGTLEEGA